MKSCITLLKAFSPFCSLKYEIVRLSQRHTGEIIKNMKMRSTDGLTTCLSNHDIFGLQICI